MNGTGKEKRQSSNPLFHRSPLCLKKYIMERSLFRRVFLALHVKRVLNFLVSLFMLHFASTFLKKRHTMTQTQKERLKAILAQQIDDVQESIKVLKEKSAPVEPDISLGRLTRQEARQEQEIAKKLLDDAQVRLKKLHYTQSKIDEPHFGECRICEEAIAFERLCIYPETTMCIACANELHQ